MQQFADLLKTYDLKATFQRLSMLEIIDAKGHLSIDEIYEELKKIHPALSLATVYKNIISMVERGVLVEVPILHHKPKYEIVKNDHIHMICTECGSVEDKPLLQSAGKELLEYGEKEDFTIKKQLINLYGLCPRCAQKSA